MATRSLEPHTARVITPAQFSNARAGRIAQLLLSKHSPHEIGEAITILIDVLDLMGGDTEAEITDAEDDFAAWHKQPWRGPGCDLADPGEDDDLPEEDDPAGMADEDGINTAVPAPHLLNDGPGCPVSDPGEPSGRWRKPVYGSDQTRPEPCGLWNGKEPDETPVA